ncbi:putative nuclease HARBI1 [Anopheles funestus]|uniref:putative nuclease HARBI1 n=1 Tax=Anopheles funestus TaxID=62324 RepID=UPI0020C72AEE|nr:putative nuclease HARBI1 [Anopheles funestus]
MISAIYFLPDLYESDDHSTDSDEHGLVYGYSSDSSESSNAIREPISLHFDNDWFLKCFNVSRDVFNELYNSLVPVLKTTETPTAFEKLAATLRYLAKGTCTSDTGAGGYKAMPRKAFQAMFPQTINAMHELICKRFISLKPSNSVEQTEAEIYFREHCPNLPGVALCAIGTHMEIAEPKEEKHLFYYKYGSYSLNALLVCDYMKRIRYVNASFCGSLHDSHLWVSSDLDNYFADSYLAANTSCYVLAKSKFPSKPWILTPIENAKAKSLEAMFNDQHAKTFAVAEETISLLKNRFRCLLGKPPIPYTPAECVTIIDVCCALHNMCIACKNVK